MTIGEPIGTVEVKVLTSQTRRTSSAQSVIQLLYVTKEFSPDKNVGDKDWIISLGTKVGELTEQFVLKVRPF